MAGRDEIIRLLIETGGEDQIDALADALKQLEQEAVGGGSAAQALAAEFDRLSKAGDAAGAVVSLKAALADTEAKLGQARQRLHDLNETYTETERSTRGVAREFSAVEKAVAGLEDDLTRQNLALQRMTGALAKAGVDVTNLAREEQRLRDEAVSAAAALHGHEKSAQANAESAQRNAAALKRMGEAFAGARDKIGDIAAKLTAAGAAAAAAAAAFAAYKAGDFFRDAVAGAADFQAQISEIGAVSGATGAELEMLREAARTAALDAGESFGAVTATLGELARAVGSAQRATEMLGPTLDLSTAGGLEAAQAAEILTTTLTQFGLAAEDATNVADLLANGANVTTASVQQLGNALSYSAPLARQLGMTAQDTVAAIGALADEGFRGERAGTALRNVLSALSDPSSKFAQELDKIGIKTRNFNEVMKQLAAAGDRSKDALLSLDAAARPQITALVNSGAAGIDRLNESFDKMEVTARSAAEAMRDNLHGSAAQAAIAFQDLRNQLVQPLLEPLAREFRAVAGAMREFSESPEFAKIQTALKAMFDAGIDGAREFLSSIDWVELSQQIADFADSASEKIGEFSANAREYVGYLKEAFNGFAIVVDALQTGIFGIAAALAKVGETSAQVTALYLELQMLVPGAQAAASAIGVDLAGAVERVKEVSGGLGAVYDEFAARTAKNFEELREGLDRVGTHLADTGEAATEAGAAIEEGFEPARAEVVLLDENLEEIPAAAEAAARGIAQAGREMSGSLDAASHEAKALAEAFATLKIESQASLSESASKAQSAFEKIEHAARQGSASIADVRAAFEAYARAQLAASANMGAAARAQVESMLRIKAAAIGATDALARLGISAHRSTSGLVPQADNAASSIHRLADAAERASGSVGGMGKSAEKAGGQLDKLASAANRQSIALGEMSAEAAAAYGELNKYAGKGDLWSKEVSRLTSAINEQRAAWEAEVELIERASEGHDGLSRYIERVRSEYRYMSDDQVKHLAQLRQRSDEARAAKEREAAAENGMNANLREGNQLLRERAELTHGQVQAQAHTQRHEVTVKFEARAARMEFDIESINESQWRRIAEKLIAIIRRDMQ